MAGMRHRRARDQKEGTTHVDGQKHRQAPHVQRGAAAEPVRLRLHHALADRSVRLYADSHALLARAVLLQVGHRDGSVYHSVCWFSELHQDFRGQEVLQGAGGHLQVLPDLHPLLPDLRPAGCHAAEHAHQVHAYLPADLLPALHYSDHRLLDDLDADPGPGRPDQPGPGAAGHPGPCLAQRPQDRPVRPDPHGRVGHRQHHHHLPVRPAGRGRGAL